MAESAATESVQVEVRLEVGDHVRLSRWYFLQSGGKIGIIVAVSLFILFYVVASCGPSAESYLVARSLMGACAAISLLLMLYLALALPLVARRSFATNRALRGPVRYTISREGVGIEFVSGSGQANWDVYWRACETRDAFYLFMSHSTAHVIPKRCFGSDEQMQRFREIVRASVDPKVCRI